MKTVNRAIAVERVNHSSVLGSARHAAMSFEEAAGTASMPTGVRGTTYPYPTSAFGIRFARAIVRRLFKC